MYQQTENQSNRYNEAAPSKEVLKGALAGAVGVMAMDYLVTWPMYRNEDQNAYLQEKQAQVKGKWAAHAAVSNVSESMGVKLSPWPEFIAGKTLHFMIGMTPAMVYAIARKRYPQVGKFRGLAYGASLFILFDEILVPTLGFASGPRKYPWQAHWRGLLGHLMMGFATDAALRLMTKDSRAQA